MNNLLKVFWILIIVLATQSLIAQSINGVYSDGTVYLHLEERTNDVHGWFSDPYGTWFEISFISTDEGLLGDQESWMAFIPWDSETMTLVIMNLDANKEPLMESAHQYELQWISELPNTSQETNNTDLSWSPIRRFGVDFYPSYVLATATWSQNIRHETPESGYSFYGDTNGYLGVSTSNFPAGSTVRVEIEGEPIIKKSSYTVSLPNGGINEVYPMIEYNYDALKNITQAKPVNFKYKVYLNDVFLGEQMEVVWVRSVNDAITIGQDHYGNVYGFDFIFAAYVNENEPQLDLILGKTLDYDIVTRWIGYQGSSEDVINQVFALWYHFQKEGFRYSSITTQSGSDDRSSGQVVRFVKDAINSTQANCIDGTVLFASFLYKIGIDVSIILVPGHAYLAFNLDPEGQEKLALETTMMGNLDIEHTSEQEDLYNAMNGKETSIQQSWSSFLGALDVGTANYFEKVVPQLQNGDPNYMEINIKTARQQKIRPIK